MKKILVLKPLGKSERVSKPQDKTSHRVLTVRNNKRAVKRVLRKYEDSVAVISTSWDKSALGDLIIPFNGFSVESVLEIIEKVCREISQKFEFKIPFEELYLFAEPATAYRFIKRLVGMSRIFTVVTEEKATLECDRLYFEYGCIIRHTDKIKETSTRDVIAIFIERTALLNCISINMTNEIVSGSNVINISEISVSDKEINEISKDAEGCSGLSLYNLLGKLPPENAEVDINKKADIIFILDTKRF